MSLKIGIVGPCAAGKSTLVAGLKQHGIHARHIAQEHSFSAAMWRRITNPDVLIYLDVSYENTLIRRRLDWSRQEYEEQLRRLEHARAHADLYIDTNPLTPEQVLRQALDFIQNYEPPNNRKTAS